LLHAIIYPMSYEKTDKELIDSYKDGNEDTFKELIERYSPSVFNLTARIVGKEYASDIVQDIFIKVWKNLKKFDVEKSSFKTWIFIISKNTCYDFLKKKKSISFSNIITEDYIDFSETIEDENLLPDEEIQKLQDSVLLNKLLDELSINYKTVLTLHYQEEMTFEEIGKILDKPLNTIKSWHYRAILELRRKIK